MRAYLSGALPFHNNLTAQEVERVVADYVGIEHAGRGY